MPKLEVIHDANLGSIAMPSGLRSLLADYCVKTHRTKSDVVRSALAAWLHADMSTIIEDMKLTRKENHNGNQT